jgi:hypothetical protein
MDHHHLDMTLLAAGLLALQAKAPRGTDIVIEVKHLLSAPQKMQLSSSQNALILEPTISRS